MEPLFCYRLLELEIARFQIYQQSYVVHVDGFRRIDVAKTRNLILEGGGEVMWVRGLQGYFLLELISMGATLHDEPTWSVVAECFPLGSLEFSGYAFEIIWEELEQHFQEIPRCGGVKTWLTMSPMPLASQEYLGI